MTCRSSVSSFSAIQNIPGVPKKTGLFLIATKPSKIKTSGLFHSDLPTFDSAEPDFELSISKTLLSGGSRPNAKNPFFCFAPLARAYPLHSFPNAFVMFQNTFLL